MLKFDHLNPTEFEEFIYDLLVDLGFSNVDWRKGTGLSSSGSDSGRDIEATKFRHDVDGSTIEEKWYIECKHHKKGVPARELENTFSWADANRPHVLLFAVSGFLSNGAKDNVQNRAKNQLPYRVVVWEQNNYEKLTLPYMKLREKFGFPTEVPFLSKVHKNHLMFSLLPQLNTTSHLLHCMEKMEEKKRTQVFYSSFLKTINPPTRNPISPNEKLSDLIVGEVSFGEFSRVCRTNPGIHSSPDFARNIVSESLAMLFHVANPINIEEQENEWKKRISIIEHVGNNPKASGEVQKSVKKMLSFSKKSLKGLRSDKKRYFSLYNEVCEEFLPAMLSEEIQFSNENGWGREEQEGEFSLLISEALDGVEHL